MTREEKIAFEFGKTFNVIDEKIAPCYDDRMENLVSESRTERGSRRNQKNMRAWWNGLAEANPTIKYDVEFMAR